MAGQEEIEEVEQLPAPGQEERAEGSQQLPSTEQEERLDGSSHHPSTGQERRVEGSLTPPSTGQVERLEGSRQGLRGEAGQQLPSTGQEVGQEREEPGLRLPGREVRGLGEGQGEEIGDRIRPVIPEPNPEAGRGLDIDGWTAIARVGAWEAMLSEGRRRRRIRRPD